MRIDLVTSEDGEENEVCGSFPAHAFATRLKMDL